MKGLVRIRGCFGVTLTIIVTVFLASFGRIEAMRPLKENQTWLLLESLPKGHVSPSTSNPCTFIPKSGGTGHCALSEMHFSGGARPKNNVASPVTTFPQHLIRLVAGVRFKFKG
ncbi:hypothetical protein vseg_016959 [Gypsophila vaccaria]